LCDVWKSAVPRSCSIKVGENPLMTARFGAIIFGPLRMPCQANVPDPPGGACDGLRVCGHLDQAILSKAERGAAMNTTIDVMTLNLRFGLADDGPNGWDRRKGAFPSLFASHPAELLSFQEANGFQIDALQQMLPGFAVVGRRSPAPSFWQNNVIFYRRDWICCWWDHFFLSPTPDWPSRFRESRWPRQCTLAVFEKEGQKLICLNTHLDFSDEVQAASARLIMRRLAALPAAIPVLLMGDFNTTPAGTCYGILTGAHRTDDVPGPFFRNSFQPPLPGTFHGFSGRIKGGHIDWMLYRGPIVSVHSRTLPKKFCGRFLSDHCALHGVFAWTPKKNSEAAHPQA